MTKEISLSPRRPSVRARFERLGRWVLLAFCVWADYQAWQDYTRLDRAHLVTAHATVIGVEVRGARPACAVVSVDRGDCPLIEFPKAELEVLRSLQGQRAQFLVEEHAGACCGCVGWSASTADPRGRLIRVAEIDSHQKRRAMFLAVAATLMLGLLFWNPPWIYSKRDRV